MMSYAQQEEVCVAILAFKPDASVNQLDQVFRVLFGIPVTRTAVSRARSRLFLAPRERLQASEKGQWVQAQLSIYPELATGAIQERCKELFGESIRGDLVEELRATSLPPDEAMKILRRAPVEVTGRPIARGFVES